MNPDEGLIFDFSPLLPHSFCPPLKTDLLSMSSPFFHHALISTPTSTFASTPVPESLPRRHDRNKGCGHQERKRMRSMRTMRSESSQGDRRRGKPSNQSPQNFDKLSGREPATLLPSVSEELRFTSEAKGSKRRINLADGWMNLFRRKRVLPPWSNCSI